MTHYNACCRFDSSDWHYFVDSAYWNTKWTPHGTTALADWYNTRRTDRAVCCLQLDNGRSRRQVFRDLSRFRESSSSRFRLATDEKKSASSELELIHHHTKPKRRQRARKEASTSWMAKVLVCYYYTHIRGISCSAGGKSGCRDLFLHSS